MAGTEIKMPQLGESVVEGTISKWLKKEGETIGEDELLVEISTDKVDSEVPSSASGVLQKILVPEGETVSVGTPIAVIGAEGDGQVAEGGGESQSGDETSTGRETAGNGAATSAEGMQVPPSAGSDEAAPPQEDTGEQQAPAATATEHTQDEPAYEPQQPQTPRDQPARDPSPQESADPADGTRREPADGDHYEPARHAASGEDDSSKRGIISPLVRRLADENDVNLEEVGGSGTGGRIRKQDVMRFIEERKARPQARPAASAQPAPEPEGKPQPERRPEPQGRPQEVPTPSVGGREDVVPWTNIRRRTAEHMVASHLETARAWNAVEADWTAIAELRARHKDAFKQREGFGLTYLPFLAKLVCDTLLEMPEVNSAYDEQQQANVVKHYVNLGIAVALEGGGLIVPVVQRADEKTVVGLARAINEIVTKARSKKLVPDDLAGGTFTITNPGPFGSIISVPIIPRGQTAILGFEAIEKRVVVTDDDAIAIRSMGFLSMSWDHRSIDGAEAARFLARLRERVGTTDFASELAHYG
jgi:pyruvate dehydrogenase E2 component (dihydrolipoamide acetyltransferase)